MKFIFVINRNISVPRKKFESNCHIDSPSMRRIIRKLLKIYQNSNSCRM